MRFTGLTRRGAIGAAVMLAALVFAACYTDYGLTYSDYDVVVTRFDQGTDFGTFKTFYMADTVFIVGDTTQKISDEFDRTILDAVAANFEARGYQRIADPNSPTAPDFVVQVGKSTSTTITVYGGGYWGGYYPWYPWGPGWGWYPYYPPTVSSYSQGSVLVGFVDPAKSDPAEQRLGVVWFGGVNGLLGDVTSGTRQRIYNSINQMFIQSPYLGSER